MVLAVAMLAGCGRQDAASRVSQLQAPPVDVVRVSPGDAATWRRQKALEADLNGDGAPERLMLAADVQLSDKGDALWEDGHRWAAFVADAPDVTRRVRG